MFFSMYLGWEELAFPRQKADPSEFYTRVLSESSKVTLLPLHITFGLESGLFSIKKNFWDPGRDENAQLRSGCLHCVHFCFIMQLPGGTL